MTRDPRDLKFLNRALQLAIQAVENGGGPFGAIVVRDGTSIAEGLNQVELLQDSTAHAEVQAIRAASRVVGSRWLTGCTLYSSAEPCPMCLAASYWADIARIVYAVSTERARELGLADADVYQEIGLERSKRRIPMIEISIDDDDAPFRVPHKNRSGLRWAPERE